MMNVSFSITVKSPKDGGSFIHTHDVSGKGVSLNECRRKALDELAAEFPTKGKDRHEFIAIKQL
tara:strand:- start:978 stop:1169 length:192 start_codon:yes stop_codon:yes gene_type:complete